MRADVVVRRATEVELDAVGRLSVDAYLAGGQIDCNGDDYSQVLADAHARHREALVLVAVREGAVVGSVTICPPNSRFREISDDGESEFRFLAIDPSAWGTGLGELLVEHCLAHAREVGSDRLVICVRDTNDAAMALYLRCGFERIPERDWCPVPGVALLAMQYTLH
jgi:ribosomal protein S18 acetylase RimI-like enzyme